MSIPSPQHSVHKISRMLPRFGKAVHARSQGVLPNIVALGAALNLGGPFASSCKSASQQRVSDLSVTNAFLAEDFYPSIVQLDLAGIARCTGSFINPTTLLTANHCVRDEKTGKPIDIAVIGPDGSRYAALAKFYYDFRKLNIHSVYDVALVKFDPSVVRMLGIKHYLQPFWRPMKRDGDLRRPITWPLPGTKVYLVGYGGLTREELAKTSKANEFVFEGAGQKRMGSNTINATLEHGLFEVFGQSTTSAKASEVTGLDSGILPGDSGGPLLDPSGLIIGVNAHISLVDYDLQNHRSMFTNLFHDIPRALMQAAYFCPEPEMCPTWFHGAGLGDWLDLGFRAIQDSQTKEFFIGELGDEFEVGGDFEKRMVFVEGSEGVPENIHSWQGAVIKAVEVIMDKERIEIDLSSDSLPPKGSNLPRFYDPSSAFVMAIHQSLNRRSLKSDGFVLKLMKQSELGQSSWARFKVTPNINQEWIQSLTESMQLYRKDFLGAEGMIKMVKQSKGTLPPRYTMGFTVAATAAQIHDSQSTPQNGLRIVDVFASGPNVGVIEPGDILLSIDGRPMDSYHDLFDYLQMIGLEQGLKQQNELAAAVQVDSFTVWRHGELHALSEVKARLRGN